MAKILQTDNKDKKRKVPTIVHSSGMSESSAKKEKFDGKMSKEDFFTDMDVIPLHVAQQQRVIEKLG